MGFNSVTSWLKDFKTAFNEKLLSVISNIDAFKTSFVNKMSDLKTSLGTWWDNCLSSLSTWFDNLKTWISTVNTSIWDSVKKIGEWFGNVITSIGEWFTNLITNLGEWFKSVGEWIAELPQKIADLFKELFLFLFVPEDNAFLKFKDLISGKFPIIDQLKELSSVLFGFSYGSEPIFTFTYNGAEYPLIDLTPFNKYKIIINSIVVAICYFIFIMRLIKRVPSLIRGL